MSQISFAELGLPSELVDVLSRNLIKEPFEIQALAIPDALAGRDILGRAPTGSGKTAGLWPADAGAAGKGNKEAPPVADPFTDPRVGRTDSSRA